MIDAEHAGCTADRYPSQRLWSQVHDCGGWDYAGLREAARRARNQTANSQIINSSARWPRNAAHKQSTALLHQTACAVRCAEGGFRIEAFFVASLKTSLVWDSSS